MSWLRWRRLVHSGPVCYQTASHEAGQSPMTDDDTTEETLDDEDVLGEGDIDADLDGEIEDEIFVSDDADDGDVFEDDPVLEDDDEASEEEESAETPVPLDASEDGDDELDGQPPVDLAAIEGLDVDDPLEVAAEVEDEDTDDAIREGEFVCTSCHMAKRSSALADADEMLCRDCV